MLKMIYFGGNTEIIYQYASCWLSDCSLRVFFLFILDFYIIIFHVNCYLILLIHY